MAGEFCQKRTADGRRCIIASEHYGPCAFGTPRSSLAEAATVVDAINTGRSAVIGGVEIGGVVVETSRPSPAAACARCGADRGATDANGMCMRCAYAHGEGSMFGEAPCPSPAEAAIYERGGYVPPTHACSNCEGVDVQSCVMKPTPSIAGTPATMLGEALAHIQRARDLVAEVQRRTSYGHHALDACEKAMAEVDAEKRSGMLREAARVAGPVWAEKYKADQEKAEALRAAAREDDSGKVG